ncbi:class I SAM-dependent methyltransferase [Streptomyces avicenniae]|uniref:class I SAM-dependent methyltransferase n=1 Tax=Streptomyces avicenniae TaxID=500153 RepID=UPI00069A707D|nr:class I SAM-dependent methyltransferase [Streptomyces avicenniae]
MPTLPPDRPRRSHELRAVAESFGIDAARYDRARPRYPRALIERIAEAAAPGRAVLDVGCGTGIASRQLRAAGCRVLGVETDARMAEVARRLGDAVEVAAFEDWRPEGRVFDAVVAGQAWHWIAPAAGAVKAAGVLRPGGLLAPFWNAFAFPPELADDVAAVLERALPGAPFDVAAMARGDLGGHDALTAAAVEGIRASGAFAEPRHWRYAWELTYTRDAWLDQMPTQGAFTRLPPDALAAVLDGVGAAIDARGGVFTVRYETVAVAATRTDA